MLTFRAIVAGEEIDVLIPQDTKKVLEYTSFILPTLHLCEDGDNTEEYLQCIRWQIVWLSELLGKSFDWVDENLGPYEITVLCAKVIEKASIKKQVKDEIQEYAKVIGLGGCECAICVNPDSQKWSEKTYNVWKNKCKFSSISTVANSLLGKIHSVEKADPLSLPFYLYDLRECYLIGLYLGRAKKERDRKKDEKLMRRLKEAGVRR